MGPILKSTTSQFPVQSLPGNKQSFGFMILLLDFYKKSFVSRYNYGKCSFIHSLINTYIALVACIFWKFLKFCHKMRLRFRVATASTFVGYPKTTKYLRQNRHIKHHPNISPQASVIKALRTMKDIARLLSIQRRSQFCTHSVGSHSILEKSQNSEGWNYWHYIRVI